jgi:hypothetical protein
MYWIKQRMKQEKRLNYLWLVLVVACNFCLFYGFDTDKYYFFIVGVVLLHCSYVSYVSYRFKRGY